MYGFNCFNIGERERKSGEIWREKKKDAIAHIPHPHLGCHFILRNLRCNSRAQCLLSASILQNSMVAQRLLRKLHIMPLCPIRTFFNYTFIAFVDAGFLRKLMSMAVGKNAQMEVRHLYFDADL